MANRLRLPPWARDWPPERVAMLIVLIAATGCILFVLRAPKKPKKPPVLPTIEVAGQPLPLDGDPAANALDLVRRYAQKKIQLRLPDGSKYALRPSSMGATIDRARLSELVQTATNPASALARAHARARQAGVHAVLSLPVPIAIDAQKAVRALTNIKDRVDRSPMDAALDLQNHKVRPEKYGLRFDVYGTLARIDVALQAGQSQVEAAAQRIKPRALAEQLKDVKFDHVIGYFETRYTRGHRYKARIYNLRIAASRLDGTVLFPGETFDFNDTVGPRDEANGYRVAPVIAQGELVDGIGGGTCQISGTLHGAAFFAGLQVVERVPHSRPSSYIKLGLDGAVAFPTINFRVKNSFDTPVVLHQTVKNGVVRAEVLGPKRERTVTFFRRVDAVIPFNQEERETDKLETGERVLRQRGIPGFRTTVFRVVRHGAYAERDKTSTEYPPTAQVIMVGTGKKTAKDTKRPKSDQSPEYLVDKYLVITQGPGIRSPGVSDKEPGGGMVESRIPGVPGLRGWQKRAGMPVFEGDHASSP